MEKVRSCARRWKEIDDTVECVVIKAAEACLGLELSDRHVDTDKEHIVDVEQLSQDLSQVTSNNTFFNLICKISEPSHSYVFSLDLFSWLCFFYGDLFPSSPYLLVCPEKIINGADLHTLGVT